MLSALFGALSGIHANLRGIDAVANNVANLNTDGYRAQRYDPASDSYGPRHDPPLAESHHADSIPSDVDLGEEMVDLMRYEPGVRANLRVIRVSDRLTGELLDILDHERG